MLNVMEEVRGLLQSRLAELEQEKGMVERSLSALSVTDGRKTGRRPGRPKRTKDTTKAPTRRKRRGGGRREDALKLIGEAGKIGINASEIASQLKMKPNYLYRVLGDMEKDGLVRKDGRIYTIPPSA